MTLLWGANRYIYRTDGGCSVTLTTLFAEAGKRRYGHGVAADGRRHVLAVGGGMLMPRDAAPLQVKYAMDLTGQARPRLCVLNTAAGDDPNANLRFYDRLAGT